MHVLKLMINFMCSKRFVALLLANFSYNSSGENITRICSFTTRDTPNKSFCAWHCNRHLDGWEYGPEHTGHFVQPHVAAHCGGDIYSRRKPLFSSFGEHTAVCGSSVRQAVARPRHRQGVCIHNIHVAATCRPSVLGSATMRGHM